MEANEVLARLASLVQRWPTAAGQNGFDEASYDGDHKSGSLVLVTQADGRRQAWLLSSADVKPINAGADDGDDPGP